MRESAQAARSFLWSHADELGLDLGRLQTMGVHIHVPAGAVPKDGPSAGITIMAALASAYTKRPVRNDTALTGEITLAGLVLPVGGIKEKVLAARRTGIHRIILPKENEKHLSDLPDHVKQEMEFVLVENVSEVIDALFHSEHQQRIA
jgi:ATP-dependent Lon protease